MRRTLRLGCGAVVVAVVVIAFSASGSVAPAARSTCDLKQLQLRDSTVNQGLGSYDRIVRGKETLVRLYFSLPSCAPSGASIQITGGGLSVSGAGSTLATGIVGTPGFVTTYPTVATYNTAPLNDGAADIKFVVPGSVLAPTSTTATYTASFSASINFQYKTSNSAAPIASSKSFSGFASKPVERRTNALRILVVPMGNARNAYSAEFPSEAVAAVENGMQTLSRIYPVPSGVGTLGGSTGGIRYAITPTILNVPTPFCGDGSNFDAIKSQLAQFLQSWNATNPNAQADRVVGAIASSKSLGSLDGCAEGMASVVSPEAWVRAFPDTTTPSMTGALLGMEVAHTFGAVPLTRAAGVHSPNISADGTALNRGYNVTLRAFLQDDHTVMRLNGVWNNNTTILEPGDWTFLLCVLGGQTNSECTAPAVAGSATGVAAIDAAYSLTGHTDGTAARTEAQESFVAANLEGRGTDPTSEYRLVQRNDANAIVQDDGVNVSFGETHHDEDEDPGTIDSDLGTFAPVVALNLAAERFELWNGTPGTGTLLWSALKTEPPSPPQVTVTPGTLRNFTNTGGTSENRPSLTTDGNWLAYESGFGINVARTSGSATAVSIPFPVGNSLIGPVLYSQGGTITEARTDGTGSRTVFDASAAGLVGPQDAEWSPDLARVVFSAADAGGNRDIYVVNRFGGGLRRLTTDAQFDTKPTWSRRGPIVFVRGPQGGGSTTELYSVWPDGTGEARLTDDAFADDEPTTSPDGKRVAWSSAGRDPACGWCIFTMQLDESSAPAILTTSLTGQLSSPDWSPDGTTIAFHRFFFPFTPNDVDVYTFELGGGTAVNVTNTPATPESSPKWSGDGATLLVETPGGLVTIPAGGGSAQPASVPAATDWAFVPASMSSPAWGTSTGDGAKLAFIYDVALYTLDVDLSGPHPLFGDPVVHYFGSVIDGIPVPREPTWSPDESAVAFTVEGGSCQEDLLIDHLDGSYTYVTDCDRTVRHPTWARDGSNRIYFETPGSPDAEIWSVEPADQDFQFETTGATPSWGDADALAFGSDGDIWLHRPGFDDTKVFDAGAFPTLAGNTFAFERGVGPTEFPPEDIFIGSPDGGYTVNVTVTDDNPVDNRLDLLVDCGSLVYVVQVALLPSEISGSTANWTVNFDPSLTCANPVIKVAVSDGYNRVTGTSGDPVETEQKPPTAAIYGPAVDSTFREYDVVPASGQGWDAEDGTLPANGLEWRLDGPNGFTRAGTGPAVDSSPPPDGFPLGSYRLTLTVTDSTGAKATATRDFTVVADADNDGLTADRDKVSCADGAASAENDPLNAFADYDVDGIPNVDDTAICSASTSYDAVVDFDPETTKVGSNGVVTAYVTVRYRSIKDVDGSTVRISSINGVPVTGLATLRWTIDKSGRGVAKFDRTALFASFDQQGITGGYPTIVVSGSAVRGAWSFAGSDTTFVH